MAIHEVSQRKGDARIVVTGKVHAGEVRAGDRLLVRTPSATIPVVVEDLVGFSPIPAFMAGQNAAVALRGITAAEIPAGSRLTGTDDP